LELPLAETATPLVHPFSVRDAPFPEPRRYDYRCARFRVLAGQVLNDILLMVSVGANPVFIGLLLCVQGRQIGVHTRAIDIAMRSFADH